MEVILIKPKGSNYFAISDSQIPPLGIAYIAAVIRQDGHHVTLRDLEVDKMVTTDFLKKFNIVGISADTPSYQASLTIAKMAKEIGKIVVMGGYHVSFLDKEALDTGLVDFVVRGEGEEIFLNLINTLESKDDLKKVNGISYLENGVYRRNNDAPPPTNLDEMPFPARDLLNLKRYNGTLNGMPFTNLTTSRGCPFNCYFCSSSKFGGLRWRARSAKSIADEIELLYRTYEYKAFSFMDDNFTLNPKRVFEFADELEKRGINDIIWWCFSRVDILIKNEAMVKRMAEVGCYMIFLGLESNNEAMLDTYNKNIENDQQEQAIKLLRKYGIKINGSYIMGDIKETVPMIKRTIKWAKTVNAESSQFSILTPYPGTALYNDVEKENRFLHKNWELYDGLHPAIKLDNVTPKTLSKLLVKAYRKLYLTPSQIIHVFHTKNKMNGHPSHKMSFKQKIRRVHTYFLLLRSLRNQKIKK